MCGIAGHLVFAASPADEPAVLARTNAAMQARGPDGSGTWFSPDGRVGLAHRRLAIIDLSPTGAQPMLDTTGDLVITFNGEIYNYRELRDRLAGDGVVFASSSDTEVILELYRRHGEGVTAHLRGMYAFAIWDRRRETLFLARDRFGMKPLYFATHDGVFRFASQVKALIAGGKIPLDPSPEGTTGFLLWGSVPEPFTLYRAIRSLEAGTSMTVGADGQVRARPHAQVALRPPPAPEQAAPALASALRDSVRHHLVADVPVGLFLSSGIDSTVLAAHAAAAATAPIQAVTVGFEEFRNTIYDETRLAAEIAGRYGLRHETVWIGRTDFEACFDRILAAMDQPSIDGVNTYFVSKAAAEAGMKVALSGIGGDELFGGYPSFRQVPLIARSLGWARRFPRLRGVASRAARAFARSAGSPKYAGIFDYGTTLAGAYFLRRGLFLPDELDGLLDADHVAQGLEGLATAARLESLIADAATPFEVVSRLEIGQYMRNQLLRDADWAGMAHSLEIRLPLVDSELERFLLASQRAGRPYRKHDLAMTAAPALSPAIFQKGKTGFRTPTWRRDPATGKPMADITDWRAWALHLLPRQAA